MAITYRDMQNPDTVDLPFAQEYSNEVAYPIHSEQPTIPINFGFNQSLSLASLINPPASPRDRKDSGFLSSTIFRTSSRPNPKFPPVKLPPIKRPPPIKPASSPHWTETEITDLIKAEHQDDIDLLHEHAVNFGKTLSDNWDKAKKQRDRIDKDIGKARATQQEFHDKFTEFGRALKAHELIPHNILPPIPPIFPPTVLIGGLALLALFLMRKKR